MHRSGLLLAGAALVLACIGGKAEASTMEWKISCVENGSLVYLDRLPHDSTVMDREAVISRFPKALCVSALQEASGADASPAAAALPPIAVPENAPEIKGMADSDLRAALAVLSGGQPDVQEVPLDDLPVLSELGAVSAGERHHDLDKYWTPTYAYAHWDRGADHEQEVHLLADVIPEEVTASVLAEAQEEPAPALAMLLPPPVQVTALAHPTAFLREKNPEEVVISIALADEAVPAVSLPPTLQAVGEIPVTGAVAHHDDSALTRIRNAWRKILLSDMDRYASSDR